MLRVMGVDGCFAIMSCAEDGGGWSAKVLPVSLVGSGAEGVTGCSDVPCVIGGPTHVCCARGDVLPMSSSLCTDLSLEWATVDRWSTGVDLLLMGSLPVAGDDGCMASPDLYDMVYSSTIG